MALLEHQVLICFQNSLFSGKKETLDIFNHLRQQIIIHFSFNIKLACLDIVIFLRQLSSYGRIP